MSDEKIKIGLAQISPVWLNRDATAKKIVKNITEAAIKGCRIVTFGEAILPGYPFWIEKTDGAVFESRVQKELHSFYMSQSVNIERGDLNHICLAARDNKIAVLLGTIELATDRGGHSIYCSRVYIDELGNILSVHRKLMPTYEERLSWSQGDGHGLQVHKLGAFTVGSLNCWENWMPMARAALYALGEDLHIAIWPGGIHNTKDITRFIAKESRSFVVSVSGILRMSEIDKSIPHSSDIKDGDSEFFANGGSCIAGPDGEWILEPQVGEEELFIHDLNYNKVREERHNFDPSGHYSRPDVLQLTINRERQRVIKLLGEN